MLLDFLKASVYGWRNPPEDIFSLIFIDIAVMNGHDELFGMIPIAVCLLRLFHFTFSR